MAATLMDNPPDEREDIVLERAFERATGGRISSPNTLQRALFPRLLSGDTGLVVPSGPGAGRLESIFVPSQTTWEDILTKQRLFIIASDRGVLDDYEYRLVPYLRALATSDRISRTLYIARDRESVLCDRFLPDGSVENDVCKHPLDSEVDIAVMRLSDFLALFFGTGQLRSFSRPVGLDEGDGALFRGRDLLYFDEAQSYDPDDFAAFIRLAEFLFAEDLDLVVGSSTLPKAAMDQLSFLDVLYVPEANEEPSRTIQFLGEQDWSSPQISSAICGCASSIIVSETCGDVAAVAEALRASGADPVVYSSGESYARRLEAYSLLRSRESEGAPYCCVTDPAAIEVSDLSAELVATPLCAPEALLLRAGRCNRRHAFETGRLVVVGDGEQMAGRPVDPRLGADYLTLLRDLREPAPFIGAEWIPFIG